MRDGVPTDIGRCPICGGTGRVKCPLCDGTGEVVCPICGGKKVVPESWTAMDNPTVKTRPSKFTLKDGRVLVGRKLIIMGDQVTIHTLTSDVVVNTADIVAEEKPSAQQ
jgi:RecJ-like exonuclease